MLNTTVSIRTTVTAADGTLLADQSDAMPYAESPDRLQSKLDGIASLVVEEYTSKLPA